MCWLIIAPSLFCAGESKPTQLAALAAAVLAALIVWWIWRVRQGDPARRPRLPAMPVLLGAAGVTALLAAIIVLSERAGTLIVAPWLEEPVFIPYPCEARAA